MLESLKKKIIKIFKAIQKICATNNICVLCWRVQKIEDYNNKNNMACVLCLDCGMKLIGVFSEEGMKLNIGEKINKHFWLELNKTTSSSEEICNKCWDHVKNFNDFYQRIYNAHEQMRTQTHDVLSEGLFATNEIKVEVTELKHFPTEEDPMTEDFQPNRKRIKTEHSDDESDDDGDIPLADFVTTDLKTDSPYASTDGKESSSHRLRRSTRQSTRLNQQQQSTNLKIESETENSDGTNDSASSSSDDEDCSDNDSLPDIEPEERYAVIPKRVVVKPKKYRKRPKPLVPPVRLSRDEIERRKTQQKEYDEIIMKFFKKFPCHICNLLVQNFADMRRHQRMAHNIESGYISCCGRKFHIRKTIAEHVLVHWNPDQFKCTQCERLFQDSRSLEVHEQSHTNPQAADSKEKRTYPCDKCPKTFTTKAALEYHNVSKHVPKSDFKFTCPECNKKVPTERKLKEHLKYMHDPETAIICDKCGKNVRSRANLRKHHELEHSDEPRPKPDPVQCEICGTWLRHLSGLKQHMKTIHEPPGEEHRCPICNKTSSNSRSLKRHIYHNHECERKFKCTMCEKAFKRPQDLREHTSTHTGEVLYTCPNCPMTFFSNANMYKHRQRLHRAEWEADRKKPLPPNIMQQAVGATTAMKKRQAATPLLNQMTQ